MYYFFIKKFLKEDQNALSFLFSLGINSGYAFYFYIFSGIILKAFQIVIIDEENEDKNKRGIIYEDDLPFIITLYKYPFTCFVIDLILYLGHFFNIFSETIILKYNLPKCYEIILLIIFQSILFPLHMIYLFYYSIGIIIVIILFSIIEILYGILIYLKYEKNANEISINSEIQLKDNNQNNQIIQNNENNNNSENNENNENNNNNNENNNNNNNNIIVTS